MALIIASYEYEDADLRRLVAPAQDADSLARVLEHPAIGGFQVRLCLNEPWSIVRREIEILRARTSPMCSAARSSTAIPTRSFPGLARSTDTRCN
jgi:hypothetical protein